MSDTTENIQADEISLNICIDNEATIYQADSLWQTLASKLHNDEKLVIDLSSVDEVDSSCIQLLLYTKQQRDKLGFDTVIREPSKSVLSIFEKLGMSSWFDTLEGSQ